MQSRLLVFIENLVVCRDRISQLLGDLNSVCPIVRTSSAWRSRNFRPSAYFAMRVSKLVLLEDARKEELMVNDHTSTGDVCQTWRFSRRSFMNGWRRSGNSVSTRRSPCLLPVVQSLGLVFGCLHAWDHQVVGVTLDVLNFWWDLMADLDAIHTGNRFFAQVTQREYRGWFFQKKKTWTNMSKSHTKTVASSVVRVVPFEVIITDGSLECWIVSCSFGVESLSLIMWNDGSSRVHWILSLSM